MLVRLPGPRQSAVELWRPGFQVLEGRISYEDWLVITRCQQQLHAAVTEYARMREAYRIESQVEEKETVTESKASLYKTECVDLMEQMQAIQAEQAEIFTRLRERMAAEVALELPPVAPPQPPPPPQLRVLIRPLPEDQAHRSEVKTEPGALRRSNSIKSNRQNGIPAPEPGMPDPGPEPTPADDFRLNIPRDSDPQQHTKNCHMAALGLVSAPFAETLRFRLKARPRRQAFDKTLDGFLYSNWRKRKICLPPAAAAAKRAHLETQPAPRGSRHRRRGVRPSSPATAPTSRSSSPVTNTGSGSLSPYGGSSPRGEPCDAGPRLQNGVSTSTTDGPSRAEVTPAGSEDGASRDGTETALQSRSGPEYGEQQQRRRRCDHCGGVGSLLVCDTCPRVYHGSCLSGPVPTGSDLWSCSWCLGGASADGEADGPHPPEQAAATGLDIGPQTLHTATAEQSQQPGVLTDDDGMLLPRSSPQSSDGCGYGRLSEVAQDMFVAAGSAVVGDGGRHRELSDPPVLLPDDVFDTDHTAAPADENARLSPPVTVLNSSDAMSAAEASAEAGETWSEPGMAEEPMHLEISEEPLQLEISEDSLEMQLPEKRTDSDMLEERMDPDIVEEPLNPEVPEELSDPETTMDRFELEALEQEMNLKTTREQLGLDTPEKQLNLDTPEERQDSGTSGERLDPEICTKRSNTETPGTEAGLGLPETGPDQDKFEEGIDLEMPEEWSDVRTFQERECPEMTKEWQGLDSLEECSVPEHSGARLAQGTTRDRPGALEKQMGRNMREIQPNPDPETLQERPDPEPHEERPNPETSEELPDPETTEEQPDPGTSEERPDPETREKRPDTETREERPDPETREERPDPETREERPDPETSEERPNQLTTEERPDLEKPEEWPNQQTTKERPDPQRPEERPDPEIRKERPDPEAHEERPDPEISEERPDPETREERPDLGTREERPEPETEYLSEMLQESSEGPPERMDLERTDERLSLLFADALD